MKSRMFGKKFLIFISIIISFLLIGSCFLNLIFKKSYPNAFSEPTIIRLDNNIINQNNFKSNDEFNYYIKDNKIILIKYIGKSQIVNIPSKIENFEVKIIADNCFENCINIETITIPSTVTEINSLAFKNCPNLIKVEFPSSIKKIGDSIFDKSENVIAFCESNSYSYKFFENSHIRVEIY